MYICMYINFENKKFGGGNNKVIIHAFKKFKYLVYRGIYSGTPLCSSVFSYLI